MTPANAPRLTWLHLSDFHLGEKYGWAQDVVLESMLEGILDQYSGARGPDLLFLTGDIAFSGKRAEYVLAEEFVRKLCEGLELPHDRVFIVPGNHDIDRGVSEDAFAGARCRLNAPTDVDAFFGSEDRRRTLFARQAEFRRFANRFDPEQQYTDSSYVHLRRVTIGPTQVRVLLLDSAWLAEGGVTDAGQLLVGERQVLDCGKSDPSAPGCLTFALVHHPLSSLREFEQFAVEDLLTEVADICLRGHVHSVDLRSVVGHRGELTTFTAGAAFRSRTAQNTYMSCVLDLSSGDGEYVVHQYNHAQRKWEASAAHPWELVSQPPAASDVGESCQALGDAGSEYPHYVACLLADIKGEVPARLPTGNTEFVRYDASIPGVDCPAGGLIKELRYHFFWRRIYDVSWWTQRLGMLAGRLNDVLREAESTASGELGHREAVCRTIISSGAQTFPTLTPACDEIRQLIGTDALQSARVVLERWLHADFLRPEEVLELTRLEVQLLLKEDNAELALTRGEGLLSASQRTPRDVALVAASALSAGARDRAAVLMHEALDLGAPIAEVRTTALRIAGATGDRRLTERVSE